MTKKLMLELGALALLICTAIAGTEYAVFNAYMKGVLRRVYKDGFRVGRVIGRDDVLLNLKRPGCFDLKLNDIIQDQDKPLVGLLEQNIKESK